MFACQVRSVWEAPTITLSQWRLSSISVPTCSAKRLGRNCVTVGFGVTGVAAAGAGASLLRICVISARHASASNVSRSTAAITPSDGRSAGLFTPIAPRTTVGVVCG